MVAEFSCGLELSVALGPDAGFKARELVVGCDVANGAMQTPCVVVLDELADDAASIDEVLGLSEAQRLALHGAIPAFELAVGLGGVR